MISKANMFIKIYLFYHLNKSSVKVIENGCQIYITSYCDKLNKADLEIELLKLSEEKKSLKIQKQLSCSNEILESRYYFKISKY